MSARVSTSTALTVRLGLANIVRFFVTAAVLLLLITPSSGFAQSTNLNKLGITVSPVTDEFDIKPGETKVRQVKVTNPVRDTVTLYPTVLNFTTDNENGQPTFYSLNEKNSRYALSDWVTFSKEFIRVAPNENEIVDVTIKAPDSAEPGGHYGAILFSTEKPATQADVNQVSVVGLIGSLMLASVPGEIVQRLALEDFDAPNFIIKPPAKFSLLFANLGSVHVKPQGELKTRNWFGETVNIQKVNEGGGNVLPESKRRFEASWTFDWKTVGRYTTTAVIAYGNPEQQVTMVRSFFVIPIWLIVIFGVLILLFISWHFRRRWKKRGQVTPVRVNTLPTPPNNNNQPKPPRIVMR